MKIRNHFHLICNRRILSHFIIYSVVFIEAKPGEKEWENNNYQQKATTIVSHLEHGQFFQNNVHSPHCSTVYVTVFKSLFSRKTRKTKTPMKVHHVLNQTRLTFFIQLAVKLFVSIININKQLWVVNLIKFVSN